MVFSRSKCATKRSSFIVLETLSALGGIRSTDAYFRAAGGAGHALSLVTQRPYRRPAYTTVDVAMSLAKQRQGQIGVNVLERIVLRDWSSRWQQLDAHNDDAVDGLIFLEKGGEMTGQVIFAQVKCHQASLRSDGNRAVKIKARQLQRNIHTWRCVVGATILVLVDPETLEARWVDLRKLGNNNPNSDFSAGWSAPQQIGEARD